MKNDDRINKAVTDIHKILIGFNEGEDVRIIVAKTLFAMFEKSAEKTGFTEETIAHGILIDVKNKIYDLIKKKET